MHDIVLSPDAVASIGRKIERDYGGTGYAITGLEGGPYRSALARVQAGDGAVFYVGSTRWGNTVSGDDEDHVRRTLRDLAAEDEQP